MTHDTHTHDTARDARDTRQASASQLDFLNDVRQRKGYEPIHADDWQGVTALRAAHLIEQMIAAPQAGGAR